MATIYKLSEKPLKGLSINFTPQYCLKWVKTHLPDFYKEKCKNTLRVSAQGAAGSVKA